MACKNWEEIPLDDGRRILKSYGTIVAGFFPQESLRWKRSAEFGGYSVTTSRHVNKWLGERSNLGTGSKAEKIPHKELLKLSKPLESRN